MNQNDVAVPLFALQQSGLWSYARGLFSSMVTSKGPSVGLMQNAQGRTIPGQQTHPSRSFLHAIHELQRSRFQGVCHFPVGNRRLFPLKHAINLTTVHDLAEFHLPGRFGWKHDLFLKRVLVPMLKRMDHVIAISHQTKRDLLAFTDVPEERISVVHNGVDESVFSPASPAECARVRQEYQLPEEYWIVVARIEHPVKNHVTLLEAYAQLKQSGHELPPMVFVGASDIRAHEVTRKIETLGLTNDVRMPGFIPLADVVALLSAARTSIFPSRFEGFGLPILESLACGTPVICSDLPVFDEFVSPDTPRFDPYQSEQLAACLLANLGSTPPQASLDPAFRWQRCADETMKVYKTLLG